MYVFSSSLLPVRLIFSALLVEKAVKGMLPKNKLGAELFRNLNVVVGTEHKQGAQKPKTVNLNDLK